MNLLKLKQERKEVLDRLDVLSALLKSEDRDFTEDEQSQWDADHAEVERLNAEIEKAEKFEEIRRKAAFAAGAPIEKKGESKEEKELANRFSFADAVRSAYGVAKLEGANLEAHQEGEKEMRNIGKSNSTRGIVIPSTVLMANRAVITENGTTGVEEKSFVGGVYSETILSRLGAKMLSGITDARIPIIGAATTQWEGETDNAADGGSAMTKVDLTPKRLSSYIDYSKQSAMQHNQSVENALRDELMQSVGAKVEYAVFTDDTSNGAPNHIGNGKTAINQAAVTDMVLSLIEEVLGNNHNRGNLGFAISHDLFSEVHQAVQAAGVSALMQNNQIMGLPTYFSNQIADVNADGGGSANDPAIYYGNWSMLNIAQFGGIEILADQYTQAIGGKDRLVLNSYWDFALSRAEAISVAGKTTA